MLVQVVSRPTSNVTYVKAATDHSMTMRCNITCNESLYLGKHTKCMNHINSIDLSFQYKITRTIIGPVGPNIGPPVQYTSSMGPTLGTRYLYWTDAQFSNFINNSEIN